VDQHPTLPFDQPERWLPVVGFEGLYEVSSLGRVRSLDRAITCADRWGGLCVRTLRGRVLAACPNSSGYLTVALGRGNGYRIYRLVAAAFLGPCPEGQEVRHGPGGQCDDRLVNLSYGTRSENHTDMIRDGTMLSGERQWMAKLTWATVAEIRARQANGEKKAALAREFAVSGATVSLLVRGKTWKYQPLEPAVMK
jgi:hypothetical protein